MDRSKLTTERRNAASADIDCRGTIEIVEIINRQDALVAPAVGRQRRQIARAVDMIVDAFGAGGRLFYVGAGTSGRLGVLDASECPPTFGSEPAMVQGIIAGGRRALVRSAEGAEDSAVDGEAAVARKKVGPADVVAGIAASGLTPFVRGALAAGRKAGAKTVMITCAPQAVRYIRADVIISLNVGPEVVTGSTRLKAGTATKLVLNTLTTAAMIRMGKVYGNLMVDLRATNAKLRDRATRIVMAAAECDRRAAAAALKHAGGWAKLAILMQLTGMKAEAARASLMKTEGQLRKALARDGREAEEEEEEEEEDAGKMPTARTGTARRRGAR